MNNPIEEEHMILLEEGAVHPATPQGTIGHGTQTSEELRLATDRPQTNDRLKKIMRMVVVIPGNGVMRIKEEVIPLIRTEGKIRGNDAQAVHSRVFKKPRCYKDESAGCIDIWAEVMKLQFEEEDLSERQECSALTSNLEGTALNCVMAKKQHQRHTAEKNF